VDQDIGMYKICLFWPTFAFLFLRDLFNFVFYHFFGKSCMTGDWVERGKRRRGEDLRRDKLVH